MFYYEHIKLNQEQFEQQAQQHLIQYHNCYATSKFDVAKIKVELYHLNIYHLKLQ